MHHQNQRGSALFVVLIGVVLFAALSYTVARSLQTGTTTDVLNKSQIDMAASSIMNYGAAVERAVAGRLQNGCTESQITFYTPDSQFAQVGDPNTYLNPTGTTACSIFNAGANMPETKPNVNWFMPQFSADNDFQRWSFRSNVCVEGVGTGLSEASCAAGPPSNKELVAVLNFLKRDVCLEINRRLGIDPAGTEPPNDNGCRLGIFYKGVFDTTTPGAIGDNGGTKFDGRMSGCYRVSAACAAGTVTYEYYHVLIPR